MFRELRRQDRVLSSKEINGILENCKFGVLSLYGEDGYPYGVPIHYIKDNDSLFFHCSKNEGHKIAAIKENSKLSFTVVETIDVIKCKSVIIFGTASEVTNKREFVLDKLVEKFVPEYAWSQAKSGIPHALDNILAYEIHCDHISGKSIDKPDGC